MPTLFVPARDAVETVQRLGAPALMPAAEAIVGAVPAFVPVQSGTAKRSYKLRAVQQETSVHVHVGSPFWHWLEYGTRWNPAYRPVQTAVGSLGLRFEAH